MSMSDLYEKIVSQRGSFERMIARIPGFRGYQEKQARRHADTQLREYLAAKVEGMVRRFVRVEQALLQKGGLAHMERTRQVKAKLMAYQEKLTAQAPGYSGMWAQFKIGEEELRRLYSFDEAQIRYIDQLEQALKALAGAVGADNFDEALNHVEDVAVEAIEALGMRDDLITNLSKDL